MRAFDKIVSEKILIELCNKFRNDGETIVFTNGCFDILHVGHLRCLEYGKLFGDILIVAINSNESVKKLKGNLRPIVDELMRAELVAGLHCVDWVIIFDSLTPIDLICKIKPNYILKGGDYFYKDVVGKDFVEKYGGRVVLCPYFDGISTTNLINKIISRT